METVDPYDLVRAQVMIEGYHAMYWDEELEILGVEQEFECELTNPETGAASRTFLLAGKLDAVVRKGGRVYVVEHKTSGEDIAPGSAYWRRLTLDAQVSTYDVGARSLGYEITGTLYDVLSKTKLEPYRETPDDKKKYTKDGRLYAAQHARDETPAEYGARIADAVTADPSRAYRRGEVVRLEQEVKDAAFDAWHTARAIREGANAGRFPRNPDSCFKFSSPCTFWPVCSGESEFAEITRFRRSTVKHEELDPAPRRLPLITNSEMRTFRRCAREHHYRYDLGYRSQSTTAPLAFGTMVHRALETWWRGKAFGNAASATLDAALSALAPTEAKTIQPAPEARQVVSF